METVTLQINETYNNIIYEYDKFLYLCICGIYFIFILLSIVLYSIFKCCIIVKKEEKNIKNEINDIKNSNPNEPEKNETSESCSNKYLYCFCAYKFFFELCNCLIYIESFIISNNVKRVGCCRLCSESIKQYCNDALCNILNNEENRINCCPCCNNYNEDDYEKSVQFFCYCYKEEGFCSWITKFFINETQKEIIPCMILYFISKLMIIGSERIYEDTLEHNSSDIKKKKSFLYSFGIVFLCFQVISYYIKKMKKKLVKKENINCFGKFIKYSNEIVIGIYINIFYNSFLNINFASNYLRGKFKKESDKDISIYLSILYNKFFIFQLNYYCVNKAKENTNLLSQSTLITIYLTISDLIITGINLIFKDIQTLLLIQIIFSGFVYLIFLLALYLFSLKNSGIVIYFNGICLCECCCCNEFSNCCYCLYCDNKCSYHENCKYFICEYCND